MQHNLTQMLKVAKAALAAEKNLRRTVEYARPEVLDEAAELIQQGERDVYLFGVKNTKQISWNLIDKLTAAGYLFHTIDSMARGGRAIDVDLVNPLTGGVMTGSSSGSCLNILLGINDFALGTDGGGSVLGPAISTGLFGFMAKGLGLKGQNPRISTDKIEFVPGVGIITYDYQLGLEVLAHVADYQLLCADEMKAERVKVAVPHGSRETAACSTPRGKLEDWVEIVEADFGAADLALPSREELIAKCGELLAAGIDLILSQEGPVDLWGRGDSVLGTWGETGKEMQIRGGKGLIRVANMLNATAVSIPTGELASGLLVLGPEGKRGGSLSLSVGRMLAQAFSPPELFQRYFLHSYQRKEEGLI